MKFLLLATALTLTGLLSLVKPVERLDMIGMWHYLPHLIALEARRILACTLLSNIYKILSASFGVSEYNKATGVLPVVFLLGSDTIGRFA